MADQETIDYLLRIAAERDIEQNGDIAKGSVQNRFLWRAEQAWFDVGGDYVSGGGA